MYEIFKTEARLMEFAVTWLMWSLKEAMCIGTNKGLTEFSSLLFVFLSPFTETSLKFAQVEMIPQSFV